LYVNATLSGQTNDIPPVDLVGTEKGVDFSWIFHCVGKRIFCSWQMILWKSLRISRDLRFYIRESI
jgi:hypothetical protein